MSYWLLKSEPEKYSVADLQRDRQTIWDGVRNYQARNFLKSMQPDDLAFFYYSNATPPGIAGLMQVVESNVIDPTQFDPSSPYYDSKSTQENPRWYTVKVEFVEAFATVISLEILRQSFAPDDLWVVRRGNRLSVMPIAEEIAAQILKMVH